MADGSPITRRYLERTPLSRARREEARRVLPGVDTRSTAWFPPYPPVAAEGRGGWFTDVDGNRYLELLNNYTSLIHGHAHPAVVEAVAAQLTRRLLRGAARERGAARRILCERVASVERVRFTNSGTEAVMLALRVARAFTGRPLIAKAQGGYHGTWDDVQVAVAPALEEAGAAERPAAVAASPGLDPTASASTVVVPYNDLDGARAILEPLGERLAALVVEPVQGAGGMVRGPGLPRGAPPADPGAQGAARPRRGDQLPARPRRRAEPLRRGARPDHLRQDRRRRPFRSARSAAATR